MAAEKTVYTFQINDTQAAYQMIMNFLNTYNFKFVDKNGMPHYEYNDYVTAKRFFEFYFQGNQITIYAYLKSMKSPMPIDKGSMGAAVKKAYRNQLDPLLEGLARLMMSANQFTDQMQGMAYSQSVVNNTQVAYQKTAETNADSMAFVSFFVGILAVLLSYMAYFYGIVLTIMVIWPTIVGMKSKKWPFAVLGAICAVLSIMLWVATFV